MLRIPGVGSKLGEANKDAANSFPTLGWDERCVFDVPISRVILRAPDPRADPRRGGFDQV